MQAAIATKNVTLAGAPRKSAVPAVENMSSKVGRCTASGKRAEAGSIEPAGFSTFTSR